MIQLVNENNLEDFLNICSTDGLIPCKIYTLYSCYKNDNNMAQFWILYRAQKPIGVMCLSGYVLTVHAKILLTKEFSDFLNFIEWNTIECDCTGIFAVSNNINTHISNLSVQKFMKSPSEEIISMQIPEIKDEIKISDLYDLLCEADSQFKDISIFDAWMCSISHRVRHGFSKVYGIYQDDKLVSTAGVYNENPICGVIESVATHPDYRLKGYACALTIECVKMLTSSKKYAYIVTSSMKTHEMYHKFGFRDSGTLFILRNPNKK